VSISDYGEELILNSIFDTIPLWVKLHIGNPGEDCTANPAVETSRQSLTNAPAVNPGGTFTSVNDLVWVNVAATEDYTFVSIWDTVGPAGGNPYWYGPVINGSVVAGSTFTISTGDLVVTLS